MWLRPSRARTTSERPDLVDMQVIVRRQDQKLCASITCMIRHYVARRAKVIFDHPHNAESSASRAAHKNADQHIVLHNCPARPPNPAHGAVRSGASAGSYQRCQIAEYLQAFAGPVPKPADAQIVSS